uniref:InlB B-repeat-containing protein n=1 Tax=Mariniflexile sp. TaxID=1979402 RepID=UPI004047D680
MPKILPSKSAINHCFIFANYKFFKKWEICRAPPHRCPLKGNCDDDPNPDCPTGNCDDDPDPDCPSGDCSPKRVDCGSGSVLGTPPGTPCPEPPPGSDPTSPNDPTDPNDPPTPPGGGCGGSQGSDSILCNQALGTGVGCALSVVGCGVGIGLCATVVGCGLGVASCSFGIASCALSLYDLALPGNPGEGKGNNETCFAGGVLDIAGGGAGIAFGVAGIAICGGQSYFCKPVVASCDPNEIIGPEGFGPEKFVSKDADLTYTINFENDPDFATAPAQRVIIRQSIYENFNPSSFRLNGFGFANYTFNVPEGLSNYTKRLSLADEIGIDVVVSFGIDVVNSELIWVFQSIDPETGLAPANALQGFLPINDENGIGEGFVTYTIKAASPTSTGDDLKAKANIFFDNNAPIPTNESINIIDALPPTISELINLGVEQELIQKIQVNAIDDDGGSGINSYDLYVSKDNGSYELFKSNLGFGKIFVFEGETGIDYCLAPVLRDNVNNLSDILQENKVCFNTPDLNDVTSEYFEIATQIIGEGSIQVNPSNTFFENDSSVSLMAIPQTGWLFDRWENDLIGTNASEAILMNSNKSVTAVFVREEYSLTINVQGNGSVSITPENNTYPFDSEVSLSANPDFGWTFDKWEGDLESLNSNEVIKMDSNKSITAIFFEGLKLRTIVTNSTCPETQDGKIELEVLGGLAPYTFDWDNDGTGTNDPDQDSKDLINVGNGIYNVTATDINGNTTNVSVEVKAEDTILPTIEQIENQTESLNSDCKVILKDYSAIIGVNDNCSGALIVEQNPVAGSEITETTNVVISVTDASDNQSSYSFSVIPEDLSPPIILPIENQILDRNENCTVYLPDYTHLVQVTDNCSNNIQIIQTPGPSSVVNDDTQITMSVNDRQGNKSIRTFIVEMQGELEVYYFDSDGDGFGVDNILTNKILCQMPNNNYTKVAGDCNDNDASINPDTTEENCDGTLNTNNNELFQFKIYPNPVKEKLTVKLYNSIFNNAIITIYDALGRKISKLDVHNKSEITIKIDDNSLNPQANVEKKVEKSVKPVL